MYIITKMLLKPYMKGATCPIYFLLQNWCVHWC